MDLLVAATTGRHAVQASATHAAELAGVQYLEELGLHGRAHLRHLVRKQRPAVRHLEEALLQSDGPGKRPLLVTEQLTLQELILESAAIDGQERSPGPRALLVDGLRDEPLPVPLSPR